MPQIAVSANDIAVSGVAIDAPLPVDWLNTELSDADVSVVAPGHLGARLSRSGDEIVVRGRVRASITTPCARCLGPASVDVDAELSLLLRPAPKAEPPAPSHRRDHAAANNGGAKKGGKVKEPEYEFSAEEAELDTYDGETVVLDAFVREAILLELPNFPLCSEACPGIAPAASRGDRAGGSSTLGGGDLDDGSPSLGGAAAKTGPGLDPRLAPLSALRDKLERAPKGDPGKRAQPASTPPAQAGAPKKKTKKE